MITSLDIQGLRGIQSGSLTGLTPLVVLLGANGSGKSTVLDALLVGASFWPGQAIGRAVQRRAAPHSTARWLFHAGAGKATVTVKAGAGAGADEVGRFTQLQWADERSAVTWPGSLIAGPVGMISARIHSGDWAKPTLAAPGVVFGDDDEFEAREAPADVRHEKALRALTHDVSLVDMRGVAVTPDLTDVLTAAKQSGRAEAALDLLRSILPDLTNLEILKLGQRYGVAMISRTGAVPVALSGDGVRSLVRLALSLAALPEGLVLLEEPEVHQHPAAIRQSARAIVEATRRGLQVVLTTHSLDLVDALLAASSGSEDLSRLSLQKLRLEGTTLHATRFVGEEIARMRGDLELELR